MSLSEALLRTIRPRTRVWRGQLLALVCVLIPTLVKLAASPVLPGGGQVVFYFPAVLIAAVWGGARAGTTALVLSTIVSWYAFTPPYFAPKIPTGTTVALIFGYLISGGVGVIVSGMLRSALLSGREVQARYKALIEAATTVTFRMDREGRFSEPNPAWSAYTGLSWLQQREGLWREQIHPDDREQLFSGQREAARAKRPCRIEFRHWHGPTSAYRWIAWQTAPIFDEDGHLSEWMGAFMDVHDQRMAQELEANLLHELQHRVKNSLAVVRALFDQTARNSTSLGGFVDAYNGRLDALSGAHGLLTDSSWSKASLEEVAATVLRPFTDASHPAIHFEGPPVGLNPLTTTNLALALHELATNASKYGALSADGGRVDLTWTVRDGVVELSWVESGGPPVKPPKRTGFGSRLLKRVFAHEPDGVSRLDYAPDGVCYQGRWRLAVESQSPPVARAPLTTTAA